MPVFFVASNQIHGGVVTITGSLHHHLKTSLRSQPGDELWIGDDQRRRYRVRLTGVRARELTGQVVEERAGPPASTRPLIVGQALLKGDRMDWVIQKATELGVAHIIPLMTGHSVVRPRLGRIQSQQERWQRIALEAAQQSERWDLAVVEQPREVMRFFREPPEASLRLVLAEPRHGTEQSQGLASIPLHEPAGSAVVLAIGPEGGWRDAELTAASAAGFRSVSLGQRVLRAETATVAAVAVLQSRLGELG